MEKIYHKYLIMHCLDYIKSKLFILYLHLQHQ